METIINKITSAGKPKDEKNSMFSAWTLRSLRLKNFIGMLFLTLFSSGAFASETSAEYEIPDTPMFMIMMGFITVLLLVVIVLSSAIIGLIEKRDLWKKGADKIAGVLLVLMLLSAGNASAAEPTPIGQPLIPMTKELVWVLWAIIGSLLAIIMFLSYLLKKLLKEMSTAVAVEVQKEESILLQWERKLTDAIPVEKEADILLDHDYDGIRELDNNLPPWWKYGFYVTIIFSFIYLIRYHITGDGDLQGEEYKKEILAAELNKEEFMKLAANKVDENSATFLEDISSLTSGKSIYINNCAACHGPAGEGGVGPNLTDEYWIHGGDIKDVFKLIKYGNPQKGMIAWQAQLNPRQMQEVASYILSLQGTNPANGKAAEGDLFVKEKDTLEDAEVAETEVAAIN
jgi:cytochrome c oxidase cbb3-type subunit III